MRCKTFLAAAMAMSFLAVANVQAAPIVLNPSFETNNFTVGTVYTDPLGGVGLSAADWTLGPSDTSVGDVIGLTDDSSLGGFTGFDGGVAAVIEGTGFIEQSVSGFDADDYIVSFLARGRAGGLGPQPIKVFLGGTELMFSGSSPLSPLTTGSLVTYTSDPITVAAGTRTLRFEGTIAFGGGVDLTTVIDNVSIAIPEPSSALLMLTASLGMIGLARRRHA